MSALGCGFNRSMQHLNSNYREEDVVNEVATDDLRLRGGPALPVGDNRSSLVPGARLELALPYGKRILSP